MIGKNLGNRYRILREIGTGGMAKVYLAEDLKGNELVAVKILYPQFSEDISFIQRFIREAKLASTLTDPHIVRVLDYGADRDLHYLVMEYVEGQDLYETLEKQGPFDWKFALETVDQLATALEHAHAHGVVHRDIKPQNMMLNENGLLKVLDFGIARIPTLPSLTQSGFIGSPYYASPEQAMGEEVDIRSDIYSSGIVLYELLSGNIPFDAKSPWSIISQHITSEPPVIVIDGKNIPENVQALLDRMMAKRPDERFQNPAALRQAVAAVLAGQPLPIDVEDLKSTQQLDKAPMVESLHERATQAIEAREWARAVDLLSQAAQLDPNNEEIAVQLADVEREARLSSLYKTGTKAMDSGRWEEAVNHFNVIAELEPTYKDTSILLTKSRESLKRENSRQFITTRYKEGVAHFEAERWGSAVEAFEEVYQLAPDHEQVKQLLAEAKQQSNPGLIYKIQQHLAANVSSNIWRWGLVAVGVIAIIGLLFWGFGNNNQASGNDNEKQRLKVLYEEAQQAIDEGNNQQAIAKLEQILDQDPDYADAADIKRELLATPTPTLMPTPTIVVVTPTPEEDPLTDLIEQAQEAVNIALWPEAIDLLNQIQSADPEYQKSLVSSLFCDAYAGRGVEYIATVESQNQKENVQLALVDFEAGIKKCPRRMDLQEQAARAGTYLEALDIPKRDFEALILLLNPIVAAAPEYAAGNAKTLLYQAYLNRGKIRQEEPQTFAAALGDYEAALALNVNDPSEAQTRRAELLLAFSQQANQQPVVQPEETVTGSGQQTPTPPTTPDANATATPTRRPTPEPPREKYAKPQIIGPPEDVIFAGEFTDVILEWESVGELQADEYYDLTIMHIFADEPNYTGSTQTREPQIKLSAEIGVGEAGGDRFYWWVTVRKDKSAPRDGMMDLPLSPQSDVHTFIWTP